MTFTRKDVKQDFVDYLKLLCKETPLTEIPLSESALQQFIQGVRMPTPDAVSQIGQVYQPQQCITLFYKYALYQQANYIELEYKARQAGVDTGRVTPCGKHAGSNYK